MQEKVAAPVTWFVKPGEGDAYRAAGAQRVVEVPGGVSAARNAALEDAFASGCASLQLSDDLVNVKLTRDGKQVALSSVAEAAELMVQELANSGLMLAGVAPTSNAFYFHRWASRNVFIVGDLILVAPCALRFDEALPCKEDYDYTVQHMQRFGGVVRLDGVLASFKHRTNAGGVCGPERPAMEKVAIARLMEKHPGFFRLNPRRENEILMNRAKR